MGTVRYERPALERGGERGRIGYGYDAMHDGMDSAEIGVATGNQPWKCKAPAWQDDSGIECTIVPIFQTAQMGDRVLGGRGIFPSDGGSGRYGG